MTSVKPYFIKALHEWISDNGLTPLIVVDANYEGTRVPDGIIEDGKVVLNISYDASQNLIMDDELVTFNARFSGNSHAIMIPMEAISAIYARENGKGMMFDVEPMMQESDGEEQPQPAEDNVKPESSAKSKSKSHLKLVD